MWRKVVLLVVVAASIGRALDEEEFEEVEYSYAEESHMVHKRSADSDLVHMRSKRSSSFSCENGNMTNELRNLFLNTQNEARLEIANGFGGFPRGLLPKSRNMYKLGWSCDLEKRAQDWVHRCEYMEAYHIKNQGQNYVLKHEVDAKSTTAALVLQILTDWRNEIVTADIEDELYYNTALGITNWANMIYGYSTQVGCAVQRCGDKLALTCFYDKAGDIPDQPIYEQGTPCQYDYECTVHQGSHCVPGEGLCYFNVNEYDANEMERSTRICPKNPRMTDAARTTILDWHNALRSSVIRGLQMDGKGGYAPMGRRMLKMHYDCALERSAQEAVDQCVFKMTRNGRGENMFVTGHDSTRKDQISLLQQAAVEWWTELKGAGVGLNNTFTPYMLIRRIDNYSQMAWGETYRVGCATRSCLSGKFYVVCHYSPHGNQMKKRIYDRGVPCTSDLHCDRGQLCSIYEGLCVVEVE